jgi:hypothetical protein
MALNLAKGFVDAQVGQGIRPFIAWISSVALDPPPFNLVPRIGNQKV